MSNLNLRQQYIADAIKTIGGTPTFAQIEAALEKFPEFNLVQADLDELPPLPVEAEFSEVIEPTDKASVTLLDLKPSNKWTEPDPDRPVAGPSTIDAAERDVVVATDALSNARNAVNVCERAEKAANDKLSRAILNFQQGFQPYSPEQLRRDHINSEQAERARIAEHGGSRTNVPTPGNSVIDRQRAWARGTGPDDGRGNAGRAVVEGGRVYPQSMRGAYIGPPKPPSVR